MKYVFYFICILTYASNATAASFSLAKLEPNAIEKSAKEIKKNVGADDTNRETLFVDNNQSFLLKDRDQRSLGYLIPVKFNSKVYKNTICRLYFLSIQNDLRFADLFAEKNDENDIVSSCVGIEAVAIQDKAAGEAFYLAVVRYRTVNSYGSRAAALTYKNGALFHDEEANRCINADGDTDDIRSVKRKLRSCSRP